METIQVSINRQLTSEDVVYIYIHTHTHNGILLSHKKERNIAVFSNMDGTMELENIILGEVSQTDKNKYYMISLICGN